jgi:hypothetical protein
MPGMYSRDELDNINREQMEDGDFETYHDELERDHDEAFEPEEDEDIEDDFDGQPDEAQEWHDFDPDC